MPFRPLAARDVRWTPTSGAGLEHLHLTTTPDGIVARSVVVGTFGDVAFGASYEIRLGADWHVSSFRVETVHGEVLDLRSPAPGRWVDASGDPRVDLDGCVDIDLSATPFTNTLPIRRAAIAPADGEVAFRMLYVPFDTLEPFPDTQFYTAIEADRLYRFVNDDRSFTSDLAVDEDGLVTDYPGLFKRL